MKNTASFSRISAAVGLILGAAATAVFAQTDYSLIQKYRVLEPTVAKAQKYLDQGQVDRCTAEINRCFETVPDHHGAQYIRAQVLYKQAEYAAALEAMGQARVGYRRLVEILEKFKAEKIMKQMDDAQALAEAEPVLEARLAAASCSKPLLSGQILQNDKSLSDAKRETQGDLARSGGAVPAEYDYFAGNCLFKLKRYDEAAVRYGDAIATDPAHANSYNNLINLLYMAKRFEEARSFMDRAEAAGVRILPGLKKAVLDGLK